MTSCYRGHPPTPASGARYQLPEGRRERAPPAGRPTPELAGDRPKGRRAPTQELDRYHNIFNLDLSDHVSEVDSWKSLTACRRSVGQVALLPVGDRWRGTQYTLHKYLCVLSWFPSGAVSCCLVLSCSVLSTPAVSLFGLCGRAVMSRSPGGLPLHGGALPTQSVARSTLSLEWSLFSWITRPELFSQTPVATTWIHGSATYTSVSTSTPWNQGKVIQDRHREAQSRIKSIMDASCPRT